MDNFNYKNDIKIIFGKDNYSEIGKNIKIFLKKIFKIFLYYEVDGELIKKFGIYEKVIFLLKEFDIEFIEFGGVVFNFRLFLVYEGIKICKEENIIFILVVGGVSVIDLVKVILFGVVDNGDVWDFFIVKRIF